MTDCWCLTYDRIAKICRGKGHITVFLKIWYLVVMMIVHADIIVSDHAWPWRKAILTRIPGGPCCSVFCDGYNEEAYYSDCSIWPIRIDRSNWRWRYWCWWRIVVIQRYWAVWRADDDDCYSTGSMPASGDIWRRKVLYSALLTVAIRWYCVLRIPGRWLPVVTMKKMTYCSIIDQ